MPGLKIVEKDEFREDVFQTLTGMCRDPQYVGLDVKAMIAVSSAAVRRLVNEADLLRINDSRLSGASLLK